MTITETLAEVRGHLQFADVKTKAARRTLDVPDFLAVMLAQHLAARGVDGRKPDALVFVSAGGGPLRATHFRKRVWAPAAKAASLEGQGLTFHHLRHSAVGFLIAVNAPPRVIQRRMGHSSIRVTFDVYGLLVAVDYPDAVTGGLRRTTDAFRAVLERTRSDLTTTLLQTRLQASIDRAVTTSEWGPR